MIKVQAPMTSIRILLLLLSATATTNASEPATTDSSRSNWYDTLEVTAPRYARITSGERLALSAFAALSIPVGLAVGGTSVIPPTLALRNDRLGEGYGFALGSGLGFGGDTTESMYFPRFRVQFDVGYYFERDPGFIVHASALVDRPLLKLDADGFGWVGIAGGGGVATDFSDVGPFAEAWVGLLNPMGIQFIPFYPMHHFGVRGRVGYDVIASRRWYDISIGVTSTFQWKW